MAEMAQHKNRINEMTTYIGHARADYDHKAGDSSGKEVCITAFTYSTSNTSVYNWTYVFRPKDNVKALKAASMCEKGCANNNIGYCSSGETKYGKDRAMTKLAKAANYDLSKIKLKCGCSCGDLICLCNHYAGLSTCYIGSGKQLAENLKGNKNFSCYRYSKGMALKRGDVLITAHSSGKNNHVVMCVGSTYGGTFPTLPSRKYFKAGDKGENVKRLQSLLNWLVGAGLKIDGEIGSLTINAVKSFQHNNGLTTDGEFGSKSLAKAKEIKK